MIERSESANADGGAPERPETPVSEAERFFRLSLEMLCTATMDGRFTRVSPAFTETLGWSRDELLTRPYLDFVHPDDREATLAEMQKLRAGSPTTRFENRYQCRDGSWRWLSWRVQPVAEDQLVYGSARDVTERRQMEAALRANEARYRTLFTSIDQGFCIIEMIFDDHGTPIDYRFLEVNPSFEQQTGLRDAVGRRMREIAPDHEAHWFELYGRVATTGATARFQNPAAALHRWYDVYAFRVGEPEARQVGILFDDITERKRSEERIVQLNTDLEIGAKYLAEANKELESFSYSVSHDLRAPLRHVQGYVDMLERETAGQLSEEAQRYLRTIGKASLEMGQLIDDLLAFSRMTRTEMRQSLVDLNVLVQEAIQMLGMIGDSGSIEWRIAPLPPVLGDRSLLKHVLTNLIGNAMKYSRGRAPARIEVGEAGEEEGRVVLFVKDNGAGFDMQYAHKLFGVFQRLHRSDEFEGTGIGLAIARRVIDRHGGRMWADAAVDAGATFYFTLQRAAG